MTLLNQLYKGLKTLLSPTCNFHNVVLKYTFEHENLFADFFILSIQNRFFGNLEKKDGKSR